MPVTACIEFELRTFSSLVHHTTEPIRPLLFSHRRRSIVSDCLGHIRNKNLKQHSKVNKQTFKWQFPGKLKETLTLNLSHKFAFLGFLPYFDV